MIPRIVVAGTSSGAGKTSVACGLIAALRARGLVVQGFKVGPDYIDPSYHALASGRPGRNLDAFLCGPDLIAPLVRHGSAGADVAVIEGVMGLFDGASGRGELASTGHVAKLLRAPVVLVIDAASMARSVAAVVHGYRSYDPAIDIAGVVLNKVGSDVHEQLLREAIEPLGVPVVGALRRDERVVRARAPSRPRPGGRARGARPCGDRGAGRGDRRARRPRRRCSRWRARRPPRRARPGRPTRPTARASQAPVSRSRAARRSRSTTRRTSSCCARPGPSSPRSTRSPTSALPEGAGALVLAGGFPEVFGEELSANAALRERVAAFARSGRPVVAECGGLLYLCEELDGRPMCGALPARARMAGRLSIGYREATAIAPSACWTGGEPLRGHEFHYSQVEPRDGGDAAAWTLAARGRAWPEGFAVGGVHASFLHVHWAAFPQAARRLVAAAARSGDRVPAGTWA